LIDISDVQIVQEFAERVTSDLEFKVTIFFNFQFQ